jgi:hypothetical protein
MREPLALRSTHARRQVLQAARHWRRWACCGLVAVLPLQVPAQMPAQALGSGIALKPGEDCRAALGQRVGELLQAMSEARRRRSSMTLGLKLLPFDARLKVLRSQVQSEPMDASQCPAMALMIEAERARLMELIPDQLTALAAAPAAAASPSPAPAMAPATAGPVPAAPAADGGLCGADVERARSELLQRVVQHLQDTRIDPQAMEPYLDFSRRLMALGPAGPQGLDCAAYGAALSRASAEWPQVKARQAALASAPGSMAPRADPALDGTVPLTAQPGVELCVTNLRMSWRELHLAASHQAASARDPALQARAREVENVIVQQQLAAFTGGPLSALACERASQSLRPVRTSVAALRNPPAPVAYAAAPDVAPPAGGTAAWAPAAPAAAGPGVPPASPAQAGGDPGFVACAERNRGLVSELEREANAGRAANRLPPNYWGGFDRDLAMYRGVMRGPGYALQCGQITQHLAFMRDNLRSQLAGASASPAGAPPPAPAAAQAAPPAAAPPVAPPRQGLMGGLRDRVAPAPAPAPVPAAAPAPAKAAAAAPPSPPAKAPPPPPPPPAAAKPPAPGARPVPAGASQK